MLVSIVVLCTNKKVNELDKRLQNILKRVSFSYELIYVFRSRSIYLEHRPTMQAKFVCVKHFFRTRKQVEKVFRMTEGDYVIILSLDIMNSPFHMIDSIELIKNNGWDMITMCDQVVSYSFFKKCKSMIQNIVHPTRIFFTMKRKVMEDWLLKKDISHLSAYYLPYD